MHAELGNRANYAGARLGNRHAKAGCMGPLHIACSGPGCATPCPILQLRPVGPCNALAAFKLLRLPCKRLVKSQVALAQVERNLHDAMGVARNVMMDPRLVPGGGAVEMAVSRGLSDRAAAVVGPEQVRRERAASCRVHQWIQHASSRSHVQPSKHSCQGSLRATGRVAGEAVWTFQPRTR